ncbi:MAG: plantaricin C family lantibiotic [Dermatophilaceae bacterium]
MRSAEKTADIAPSLDWVEEMDEQMLDGEAFGACSTNTFSLSDHYGNTGGWCTVSKECMGWC